ncbi:metal ABC transporter solute-binding protein, Zn/Mn family [Psychrobacter sp. DAB_AL43B]|uniref:metal ABC transporter solute-binding protein, Zn/Mn family n=1 Tax=Psychrobacter sp. DAB_AL43B TaxID=1028416 RepID=UPI0009A8F77C|nr:zinc ABC transporter substrate-binding protein [Psychrobacter sp. DAB_AL43B]SLJ85829.1 High-affinity zinc uptake system protein znuA [Psychrobacter sp. DAB_AL43B]
MIAYYHNATKTINKLWRLILQPQRLLITVVMMLGSLAINAQAATVSVSNYPLFLLSQAVTAGSPPAKQLLQAGEVGHHGSISPGDIKAIQDSTFVVWFGEPLENNLAASLNSAPNAIALFKFDAFNRHPLRDVKGKAIAGTLDPHIWLDPDNAKAITRALAVIHSHANPQYKKLYHANAQKFAQRMDTAVAVTNQNNSQKPLPYWAYHDAYQYMESSAKLQLIGSLSTDHHLAPKASQLRWLNEQRPAKKMCLVSPSQPAKGLLAKLQPVQATVQAEDMSNSKDFISGWQIMAEQIRQCIS